MYGLERQSYDPRGRPGANGKERGVAVYAAAPPPRAAGRYGAARMQGHRGNRSRTQAAASRAERGPVMSAAVRP